uniref:ubiquitinyl hydrolase 1 n=1 Tax=Arcella intermedia TaxID=1963864 RepID=A0A6B2KXL7_9EUKA
MEVETGVQQDAQEFYKYFITHVEEIFSSSSLPHVKNLISGQFRGKSQYITTCAKCKKSSIRDSSFYEIDLNIQGHSSLESCIDEYIGIESLDGNNQYRCTDCELQNADRRISLVELPQVLNFQLLRFCYDIKTGTRRKISKLLNVPIVLDMKPFMGGSRKKFSRKRSFIDIDDDKEVLTEIDVEQKSTDEEYLYDLSAVLIHIGSSSSEGHYIAHIKDWDNNKWWKFNDEEVKELEISSSIYTPSLKDTSRKKIIYPTPTSGYFKSSGCYMLSYRKRSTHVPKEDNPVIPKNVLEKVEKLNFKLTEGHKQSVKKISILKDSLDSLKKSYNIIWDLAPVPEGQEECYWISTDWLRDWISGKCVLDSIPINNSDITCAHGNIDFNETTSMKRITKEAWDLLFEQFGGGPALSQDKYCKICMKQYYEEQQRNKAKSTEQKDFLKILERDEYLEDGDYYVAKTFLTEWKKTKDWSKLEDSLINGSITCKHKKLNTTSKVRVKLISKELWDYLLSVCPKAITLKKSDGLCPQCNSTGKTKTLKTTCKKMSLYKSIDDYKYPTKPGEYFAISMKWLLTWKDWVDNKDDDIPILNLNKLLCQKHDQLLFDPNSIFNNPYKKQIFALVTPKEWDFILTKLNVEGNPIEINILPKNKIQAMDSCSPCIQEKKENKEISDLNFESAYLKVQYELPSRTRRTARRVSIDTLKIGPLSATDPLQRLKLLLMEKTNLTPVEQEIYYHNVLLNDNDQVLSFWKIKCSGFLTLKRKEELEEPQISEVNVGFSKTKLGANKQETKPTKWTCTKCTFINPLANSECEMCKEKKPKTSDKITLDQDTMETTKESSQELTKSKKKGRSIHIDSDEEEAPLKKRKH